MLSLLVLNQMTLQQELLTRVHKSVCMCVSVCKSIHLDGAWWPCDHSTPLVQAHVQHRVLENAALHPPIYWKQMLVIR